MDEIVFDNARHAIAIAKSARTGFNPVDDRCISRERRGVLMGGVVYRDFNIASISAHVAGFVDRWMSRDLLWVIFDYPFVQLGCGKVILQIPANNIKSLEFAANLGFNLEAVVKDVFPGNVGLHVLGMYRHECRWLSIKPRFLKAGGSNG